MSASTYAAHAILNLFLRGVAVTPPTRVYVSFHTADPGNAGANEVTTGAWPSYVRLDAAQGAAIATGFSAAAAKASANLKELLWAANDGAAPVTVTHFGIWDAATGGNLLFHDALTASKTFQPSDEGVLHASALNVTVD
ncbi:hypothetical protein ASC97_05595 [Rhizobium sp. Root1203]|uniref:phage tail fiber protein n=1 Tax=Rhizobium sp. Root1203 TaxID=1736427 RepID=UPI00070BC86D|nr:hypothetical protein [Rhizobium sp. Root1203]KQV27840.1 hypothetical protein ASC97_05595 [Rhizobium sp. Root1203]